MGLLPRNIPGSTLIRIRHSIQYIASCYICFTIERCCININVDVTASTHGMILQQINLHFERFMVVQKVYYHLPIYRKELLLEPEPFFYKVLCILLDQDKSWIGLEKNVIEHLRFVISLDISRQVGKQNKFRLTLPHSQFGHYFCSNLHGRTPRGPRGVKK